MSEDLVMRPMIGSGQVTRITPVRSCASSVTRRSKSTTVASMRSA